MIKLIGKAFKTLILISLGIIFCAFLNLNPLDSMLVMIVWAYLTGFYVRGGWDE